MMTPDCATCLLPIGSITASVDPQEMGHRFTAQCGHAVDAATAQTAWRSGMRWDLPAITGIALGAAERLRHFTEEGYTPEHDAVEHSGDGLAWAAWAYIDAATHDTGALYVEAPNMWPWPTDQWKVEATSTRRLIIALSLVAAEIDRRLHVDRAPQQEALMSNVVKTECSGCMEPTTVNVDTRTVTMRVPSNGRRGSLHVAAHTVTVTATLGDDLVMWDCPRCEYADSVYATAELRKALGG